VEFVVLGIVLAVVFVAALVAFLRAPSRRGLPPSTAAGVEAPPRAPEQLTPTTAATATVEAPPVVTAPPEAPALEVPPPSAGRMVRLRSRLARSQTGLGRGLLTLLARETIDEDTWDEVEETLLTADVGLAATQQIVENLRTQVKVLGARTPE
jgi:fused signal recognition particle receptor